MNKKTCIFPLINSIKFWNINFKPSISNTNYFQLNCKIPFVMSMHSIVADLLFCIANTKFILWVLLLLLLLLLVGVNIVSLLITCNHQQNDKHLCSIYLQFWFCCAIHCLSLYEHCMTHFIKHFSKWHKHITRHEECVCVHKRKRLTETRSNVKRYARQ